MFKASLNYMVRPCLKRKEKESPNKDSSDKAHLDSAIHCIVCNHILGTGYIMVMQASGVKLINPVGLARKQ